MWNPFKKKKGISDTVFNERRTQMEYMAFALTKFEEFNGDYQKTREAFAITSLSEEQADSMMERFKSWQKARAQEDQTRLLILQAQALIDNGRNGAAFDMVSEAYTGDEGNMQVLELLVEVFDSYHSEEEVLAFFETLKTAHPAESYNIQYRKGLYLKRKQRLEAAKEIFLAQNAVHEFAWNYYQLAIIENLAGNRDACFSYLEKTFELDPALKEDAKTFPELKNIQGTRKFIAMTT